MNSEDTTSRKQRSTNLEIPLDIATSGRPRRQSTGIAAFLCRVLPPEGSERKPPKQPSTASASASAFFSFTAHRQAPDAPPPAARGRCSGGPTSPPPSGTSTPSSPSSSTFSRPSRGEQQRPVRRGNGMERVSRHSGSTVAARARRGGAAMLRGQSSCCTCRHFFCFSIQSIEAGSGVIRP